jgi:hypothetical protein
MSLNGLTFKVINNVRPMKRKRLKNPENLESCG